MGATPFNIACLGALLLVAGAATAQDLVVDGMIESRSTGYKFPDSSIQATAALPASEGASANEGLYDNRIIDFSPPSGLCGDLRKGWRNIC